MSRRVLAVVRDLFFVVKLQEGARHAGVDLEVVGSGEELLERAKEGADLVVVDLSDAGLGPVGVIRDLRASAHGASFPMLGFVSHVQTDVAEQARSAGCERVVPRSQFSAKLVDFLSGR